MLPDVPAFVSPVPKPAVKVGDDARLAWRKTDAALGQANGRLVQTREWYVGVRTRFSAAKLK